MNRTSMMSAYRLYENRLFDAVPEKVRGTSRWRHSRGSILQYAGYSFSRTILVVVAMLLLLSTAFAQPVQPWRPLTFPGASTISAVLEVAVKLYVGTNSGVFVSNDKGQTWKSITAGFDVRRC